MVDFNFKRWNNITGWAVFAVSTLVYLLTMELSSSLWDCGEFIATSYKLEVGHPPGAPLFMMLARLATMLAPSQHYVPIMVNAMNAVASGFCILFLFWTITHLARRIVTRGGEEMSVRTAVAVLGAGAVGALAFAFTDTFWFSAVEGEVYALSSMFTALVVWLMLKWEEQADEPHATRWIILIAYLMGLSIGVHLLNLLTVPALVFIYFFRRYRISTAGEFLIKSALATLISFAILGAVNGVIIPYTVYVGAAVDKLFVNTFGLPVNSGIVFFIMAVFAALGWAVWATHRRGMRTLNTVLLAATMVLIGFSSYASVTIRALANPPMNSNNPDTPYSLLSMLNRDQYGNRPLLRGAYYSAPPVDMVDRAGEPTGDYDSKTTQYLNPETGRYEPREVFLGYRYPSEFVHWFPRMWNPNRKEGYERGWVELQDIVEKDERGRTTSSLVVPTSEVKDSGGKTLGYEPTRLEDIRFFLGYQMGDMFWRYFMWNFVGRQDDMQLEKDENGVYLHGGWLSGIKPVDELICGPQSDLPDEMASNRARNTYFFLPFLLGLIGLIYHLNRDPRNFIVVMWLFIMMGIALVVYFNTSPDEVRERDYVYGGAFYAFAIWIGLGVLAVRDTLGRLFCRRRAAERSAMAVTVAAVAICMSVPAVLAVENWDDHDRSGRTMARDIGWNYLNSAPEGAIVVNYGDNDTFPLWFNQEVDGVRPDIRIMNSSYLAGEWYIDEMKLAANDAPGVPFSLPGSKYSYVNDYVMVEQPGDVLTSAQGEALLDKMSDVYMRYQSAASDAEADRLAQQYNTLVDRYEGIFMKADSINRMRLPINVEDAIRLVAADSAGMTAVRNGGIMRLLAEGETIDPAERADDYAVLGTMPAKLKSPIDGRMNDYIPSPDLFIEVDRDNAIASGTVAERDSALVVDRVPIRLAKRALQKDALMMLDLLAHFEWRRPLSFTQSYLLQDYGLVEYLQFDGYTYRLVPIRTPVYSARDIGRIDLDYVYPLLAGGYDDAGEQARRGAVNPPFRYGNLADEDVYVDYFYQYNIAASRARESFARVAKALARRDGEGDRERAEKLLLRGMEVLPPSQIQYTMTNTFGYIEAYYQMGTLSLDRSITLIEEAVERLQSLTGDKTEVEFDDLDLFSYRYDMADLYTRLMAQAQQTAPAGGLDAIRQIAERSAEEYIEAEEMFGKGDAVMEGFIRNAAQYARYYMQFMTGERFTPKVSDLLYNKVADICDMFYYAQNIGGSLERHLAPYRDTLAEYVERIAAMTPDSVHDPKVLTVIRHTENIRKLADYFYLMSMQAPSDAEGMTAKDIERYGRIVGMCDEYLARDEVRRMIELMNEE